MLGSELGKCRQRPVRVATHSPMPSGLPPCNPWLAPRHHDVPHRLARDLCQTAAAAGATSSTRTLDSYDDLEEARKYRRPVFDFEAWARHRSVQRYNNDMQGVLTSRIVRGLLPPLSYTAVGSFAVCCYETLLGNGTLAALAPAVHWPNLSVNPDGAFSISTFALSLLLVFRTNSSYERWWEARTAWGHVVEQCCHLAQKMCQWLDEGSGADAEVKGAMLRWLRVFPATLMCEVREDHNLRAEVRGLLRPEEEAYVLSSPQPPLAVLSALGTLVHRSSLRIESKTHCDESIRVLQEVYGTCQRILTTPIPLSYTRHTTRFLVIWLTCMPYCIWDQLGWFTVPVAVVIAFLLLGIEEIGIQIEEPFGILALESMVSNVQSYVSHLEVEQSQLDQMYPPPPPPTDREAALTAAAAAAAAAALEAQQLAAMAVHGVQEERLAHH